MASSLHASLVSCVVPPPLPTTVPPSSPLSSSWDKEKREMKRRTRGPGPGYKKEEDRLTAVSFFSNGPCYVPACQHCPMCIHGLMQEKELMQGERGLPARPLLTRGGLTEEVLPRHCQQRDSSDSFILSLQGVQTLGTVTSRCDH